MKKIVGYLLAAVLIVGMLLLLFANKRRLQRQTAEAEQADQTELVGTYTAVEENYSLTLSANGTTQASRELNFVSDIAGRVIQVYADKGKRVVKGTPLLKIDTELYEADYKAAKAAYDAIKKDEERLARSFASGGVSDQQIANIRTQLVAAESRMTASRWKYENTVVRSPMTGTVNNRFIEVGSLLAPNVPLFEIVDDRALKIVCHVPESMAGLISKGMRVRATYSNMSGSEFTGIVKNVAVKADRGFNYPVEIVLDPDDNLHIGMYLKVEFPGSVERTGILVPRKCIVGSAKSAALFIVSDGKAQRREVKLGKMVGDRIEVLGGIIPGEKVIQSGLMNVENGTSVRVIN